MSSNVATRPRGAVWAVPDFRRIFSAIAVWEGAAWSYSVILTAAIFTQTGSAAAVAGIALSRWIPAFLVAPYAGVIADRFERRRVMLVCASLSGVVMFAMAGLLAIGAPVIALMGLSVIHVVLESPNRPAYGAMLPEVVGEKDLSSANAVMNVLENVVVILGPLLGSLLIVVLDPAPAMLVNASLFPIAVLLLTRIRSRSRGDAEAGGGALAQMRAGVSAVVADKLVVTLVLATVLCSSVYGAAAVLLPSLSEDLGTGGTGYGYLLAAFSAGSILTALVTSRLAKRFPVGPLVVTALVVEALPFALLAIGVGPIGAAIALAISGAAMTIVDIVALTSLQQAVPTRVLGRALATMDAAIIAGIAASGGISGVVVDRWGLSTALAAIAVGFSLCALVCVPGFRGSARELALRATAVEGRVALLERLDLFAGASPAALGHLADVATEVQVPAGSTIITEGEAAEHLWILTAGELSAATAAVRFPDVAAPGYVGELGLLRRAPRSATVVALTDATLLRIDGEEFLGVLNAAAPSSSLSRLADERLLRTR
ncbi:MAG TPA: MFS transporter [Candidatus Nanopelagicales bacterium]